MPGRRSLSLTREVLHELSAADLSAVVGANDTGQTDASCLHYISCWQIECLFTLTCPTGG